MAGPNDGRFKKGHKKAKGGRREGSGRPPDWLREECRKHAPHILEFLRQVALGEDVEQVVTENGETIHVPAPVRERIKASEMLLDRAYGKAIQAVEMSGDMSVNLIESVRQAREERGLPL